MIDLSLPETRRNPYPAYDQLRRQAPVVHDPGTGLWMAFSYEAVKRVLQDHDAFSSRHGPAEWMIFLDPPRHSKLRALVAQAFTSRSVAELEPRIRELSRELLDRTIERGTMDLATEFAVPLPMMVIAELLGIPVEDRPRFVRWNDAILAMSYTVVGAGEAARAAVAEFAVATGEMSDYLAELLELRRSAPREDLLTRLLHARVDGEQLNEREILGFFQLLLLAGSETTTNLINNAILCLLDHPELFARLGAEPERLPSAIEEVLRYRAPLQWMYRVSTREIELGGQNIPAGKLVLAMIGSANRDPLVFPDPDRFDITRDPNPHLSFGFGVHFCLGASLARLESRVALADLLGRLKGLALANDEPWEPRPGLHVHGPARLPICFERGARACAST